MDYRAGLAKALAFETRFGKQIEIPKAWPSIVTLGARLSECQNVEKIGQEHFLKATLENVEKRYEVVRAHAGGMADGAAWDADLDPDASFDDFCEKAKETLLKNRSAAESLPENRQTMWKDPL
jgi:hypothetical protein